MIGRAVFSLALGMVFPSVAIAQDRMRSIDYSGDAVERCFEWDTGFPFESCTRRPLPGDPGTVAQTYRLTDGTTRILTQDPNTAATSFDSAANPVEDPVVELPEIDPVADATTAESGDISVTELASPASTEPGDAGGQHPIPEVDLLLPPVVAIRPGRAEILPVATAHLNRIETPFSDPAARAATGQDATLDLQFDQNFIYISITHPVTLFIHERGYPDPAIAVSLVPHRIAPRQVRLTLPPQQMEAIRKNAADAARNPVASLAPGISDELKPNSRGVRRAFPAPDPAEKLAGLIQVFAQGRVPEGFSRISVHGRDATAFCRQISGVRYDFHQGAAVASRDYLILRGMASATHPVRLDERDCARNPQTLAVAFSPRTEIGPRQPTDFFVLLRKPNAPMQSAGTD